jgi:hypothetical protein
MQMDEFQQMQLATNETLLANEHALEASAGRQAILEKARLEKKRIDILHQLIKVTRNRSTNDALKRKITDRYVKLMQRNIEIRQGRAIAHARRMNDVKDRIESIKKKLWEEFQVPLPPEILGAEDPESSSVTGAFEEGVWLCSYRHQIIDCLPGERGTLWSTNTQGKIISYRRTPQGTIEAD